MPTPAYMSNRRYQARSITASTYRRFRRNIFQKAMKTRPWFQLCHSHHFRAIRIRSATGQRVHKPLMITKVFDKFFPRFFNALTSGSCLSSCPSGVVRTSSTAPRAIFTSNAKDAIIVDEKSHMPELPRSCPKSHFTQLERRGYFTYLQIVWTHEVSGTSGS